MSDSSSAGTATLTPPPAPPLRTFGRTFWMLNTIEMFERLAYFTFRAVAPIYIMQANDPGGLHLTAAHKASIYAWWAVFQSLLPIVTGGFADRFGYKRTLVFAFSLMTGGYVMAALLRDVVWLDASGDRSALARSNYWTLFISIMTLATGTAFFKPALQGSLAQNLTKANSSVGWGIFYWVVNIGGLIGPFVSQALLAKPPADSGMSPEQLAEFGRDAWRNLLLCAAGDGERHGWSLDSDGLGSQARNPMLERPRRKAGLRDQR